jgi:hypothetical protein
LVWYGMVWYGTIPHYCNSLSFSYCYCYHTVVARGVDPPSFIAKGMVRFGMVVPLLKARKEKHEEDRRTRKFVVRGAVVVLLLVSSFSQSSHCCWVPRHTCDRLVRVWYGTSNNVGLLDCEGYYG